MRLLHLSTLTIILPLFFFLFSIPSVRASQFAVGRYITYEITTSPDVQVVEKVIVTNQETESYPKAYKIKLDEFDIVPESVLASDFNGNPLTTNISHDVSNTYIQIDLPPTVGKDKQVEFSLAYQIDDAVNHLGKISEFALPKLNSSTSTQHQVTLKVDKQLQNKAYLFPHPAKDESNEQWHIYHYLNTQDLSSGIKAAFGEHQIYEFSIEYELNEQHRRNGQFRLVLPSDTAYQRVSFTSITPKPEKIQLDRDGNWIAIFPGIGTKSHINVVGAVMMFAQPVFTQTNYVDTQALTQEQPHWQTTDPRIKELALSNPSPQKIYNYVTETLTYNYSKLGDSQSRLGAAASLQSPENANCMEFTDLFITMSRAAGIPARRVVGYAQSDNIQLRPLSLFTDVLHAWPEYWDTQENLWRPVDPTWGNTTGGLDYFHTWDLYHFTLAMNGYDSQSPEPPIAKSPKNQPQSIIVKPTTSFPDDQPNISMHLDLPTLSLPFIPKTGKLTIRNHALYALHDRQPLIPDTHQYTILETSPNTVSLLPPLSETTIAFKYTTNNLFHPQQFIINFNDQSFRLTVSTWDRVIQIIVFIILIILYAGLCFAAFKIARKAWRVSVQG